MRIWDGILGPDLENSLENVFTDDRFEWHLSPSTIPDRDSDTKDPNIFDDQPNFYHMFYTYSKGKVSSTFDIVDRILKKFCDKTGIGITKLLRVRANLLTRVGAPEGHYTLPHFDTYESDNKDLDFMVLIYYVVDSDGPTHIFPEKVDPKKGRFVLFRNKLHAASFPIQNKLRIVINFNLKIFDPSGQFLDSLDK